jgi:vacuolar-type H+-ATPase subunit I/STV1
MDLVGYLTTPAGEIGGLEWGFLVAEGAAALIGVYLAFLRNDMHPIRGAALRRLGLALLALGGLGVIFAALRLAAIDPFNMPIWFVAVGVVELALAAFALFYWQTRYPAALAAYEQSARGGVRRSAARPQPALQTNGNGVAFSDPRPLATTSRRGSRRDRKRRGR